MSEKKKTGKNTGQLVPQPHGGAIRRGNKPGSSPGPGEPPSLLRERLRGSFTERIQVLEDFADGKAVQELEVPLTEVLAHARCPRCEGKLKADVDAGKIKLIKFSVRRTAQPKDRLKAIDLLAKYGLGTVKELSVEHVRERLKETIRTIRDMVPEEQAEEILDRLAPIWR